MPRVISIMNQKGGVGKTTTTLNLGAALALRGKRVLLIDLDPQANLSMGLGKRAADLSESVYELLTDPKCDAMNLVVQSKWERLSVIPSHIDLSGAEIEMVTMIGRESRLAKSIENARAHFDYILIDCLPSLSLLTVNAMAASSEVFVPLQAHPFALEGLGKLFEVVGMIREAMNPSLRVSGVLVTMFDGRTNVSKVTLEALRKDDRLREHIFKTTVKQNIKVAESQKDGIPVIHFDPSCHAAKAYMAMCAEVLEMESGCLASECYARILTREAGQPQQTFTADLIAPQPGEKNAPAPSADTPATGNPNTPSESPATVPAPAEPPQAASPIDSSLPIAPDQTSVPVVPSQSYVTVQPVTPHVDTSRVGNPGSPAEQIETPAAGAGPEIPSGGTCVLPEQSGPDAHTHCNTPDAESLHPSSGTQLDASPLIDPSVQAQAAQSGVTLNRFVPPPGIADDDYRPRLALKPGSCKVPLPPAVGQ